MYNFRFLLILLFIFSSRALYAQDTARVSLNDNNNIYLTVDQRMNDETELLDKALGLDSIMKTRVRSNIYTLNQMYFETVRHMNYTMEKILLIEQAKYRKGRREFLQVFLSKKKYKEYLELEEIAAKADRERYAKTPTENKEILELRSRAQGWDLLQQTIIYSD